MWHLHALMSHGQARTAKRTRSRPSYNWLLLMSPLYGQNPLFGAHRWHQLLHGQNGDEDD